MTTPALLPGAPAELRRRVAAMLARVAIGRTRVDTGARAMASAENHPPHRPLARTLHSFAAEFSAVLTGGSYKRQLEIALATPGQISAGVWSVAAAGVEAGCQTRQQFRDWLDMGLAELAADE